jgi:hypothetical protein
MWIVLLESIEPLEGASMPKKVEITSIQVTTSTRDRLYRLKFRKTYDEFLQDLCDLFEKSGAE